MEVDKQSKGWF